MSRAVLKLMHFPEALDLVLPENPELQARLQKQDDPGMFLSLAGCTAGY